MDETEASTSEAAQQAQGRAFQLAVESVSHQFPLPSSPPVSPHGPAPPTRGVAISPRGVAGALSPRGPGSPQPQAQAQGLPVSLSHQLRSTAEVAKGTEGPGPGTNSGLPRPLPARMQTERSERDLPPRPSPVKGDPTAPSAVVPPSRPAPSMKQPARTVSPPPRRPAPTNNPASIGADEPLKRQTSTGAVHQRLAQTADRKDLNSLRHLISPPRKATLEKIELVSPRSLQAGAPDQPAGPAGPAGLPATGVSVRSLSKNMNLKGLIGGRSGNLHQRVETETPGGRPASTQLLGAPSSPARVMDPGYSPMTLRSRMSQQPILFTNDTYGVYVLNKHNSLSLLDLPCELSRQPLRGLCCSGKFSILCTSTAELWVWGRGPNGQLGLGADTTVLESRAAQPIPDLPRVRQVMCNSDFVCAVTEDGGCYLWGNILKCVQKVEPTLSWAVHIFTDLPRAKVAMVSIGDAHMLFLMEGGQVYAVGDNMKGQIGNGEKSGVFMKPVCPLKKKARLVCCGAQFSTAVSQEGKLYVWGRNRVKSASTEEVSFLGAGTEAEVCTPRKVKLPSRVVHVACGDFFIVVVCEDSRVFAWGQVCQGVSLGLSKQSCTPSEVVLKTEVKNDVVTGVAAGSQHFVVLTEKGLLFGVGNNQSGQLCNIPSDKVPEAVPIPFFSTRRICGISAHDATTAVILKWNAVFGCTIQEALQLEIASEGTESERQRPDRIPFVVSDIVQFLSLPDNVSREGIFRISGRKEQVRQLMDHYDCGFGTSCWWERSNKTADCTPDDLVGCVKMFLQRLPDPLLTTQGRDEFLLDDPAFPQCVIKLRVALEGIPECNRGVLKSFAQLLALICANKDTNKMTPTNCAIAIGPSFFGYLTFDLEISDKMTASIVCMLAHLNKIFAPPPTFVRFITDAFPAPDSAVTERLLGYVNKLMLASNWAGWRSELHAASFYGQLVSQMLKPEVAPLTPTAEQYAITLLDDFTAVCRDQRALPAGMDFMRLRSLYIAKKFDEATLSDITELVVQLFSAPPSGGSHKGVARRIVLPTTISFTPILSKLPTPSNPDKDKDKPALVEFRRALEKLQEALPAAAMERPSLRAQIDDIRRARAADFERECELWAEAAGGGEDRELAFVHSFLRACDGGSTEARACGSGSEDRENKDRRRSAREKRRTTHEASSRVGKGEGSAECDRESSAESFDDRGRERGERELGKAGDRPRSRSKARKNDISKKSIKRRDRDSTQLPGDAGGDAAADPVRRKADRSAHRRSRQSQMGGGGGTMRERRSLSMDEGLTLEDDDPLPNLRTTTDLYQALPPRQ